MACSFQKEESVLIDMLMRIEPSARVFTIDTGVLFPETYEVWRKVEDRYGLKRRGGRCHAAERHSVERVELLRARARSTRSNAALAGADAWITGIRREQSPTRADAQAVEWDEARGVWKFNPLADWTDDDVWTLRARARSPVPSAARPGLRVDRLRSLHTARQRPRGPLGGAGQDGVRSARMNRFYDP